MQQKIMSRDISVEDEIADSVFVQVYPIYLTSLEFLSLFFINKVSRVLSEVM